MLTTKIIIYDWFNFGETEFPKYILRKIKKKEKYTIIDLTKKGYLKKIKLLIQFPLVNLEELYQFLNQKNVKKFYLLVGYIDQTLRQ